MDFSLKEVGKILIHVPGLILLIAIIVSIFLIFFSSPVSDAEKQVNTIVERLSFLEEIGDEIIIPVAIKSYGYFDNKYYVVVKDNKVFLGSNENWERTKTFMSPKNEEKTEKKIDFPVCPKDKDSKKPCIEGEQSVRFKRVFTKGIGDQTQIITEPLNDDKIHLTYTLTNKKCLQFYVHDSGRIIMTALP